MPHRPIEHLHEPLARRRILIVDSDQRVRASLSGLVGLGDGIEVVGAAGSAAEAIDVATRLRPDVVLVDPRLPDIDAGLRFIAGVRRLIPAVCVLVMSWTPARESGLPASIADAIIDKAAEPAVLLDAIIAASCGDADEPLAAHPSTQGRGFVL